MEPNQLMDLGGGVGWIGTLFIGALLMNIVIGIVGSYIGAFLANALGIQLGEIFSGWFWGNLIVAAIGAVVLIWALRLVRGR